jgi:hypothetical protein
MLWNRQFHALERTIPRFGTDSSTLWDRQFHALELSWYSFLSYVCLESVFFLLYSFFFSAAYMMFRG